jgi:hypothetical protein
MMFFGMAILLPTIWFFPWWVPALVASGLGWMNGPRPSSAAWQIALAGGLVTVALAFIKDGRNAGIISERMSGLFSLPHSSMIFALVFFLMFVTLFLCFQAGAVVSTVYKPKSDLTK